MRKIEIARSCEPYMYNTYDDLNKIEIGNILTLKFGKEPFRVKEEYVGKNVKFIVNNFFEHNWGRPTRRLALIPLDKANNFNKEDVLFLDDGYRFECLMIDLFPCNREPYDDWENKTVKIVAVE
jgi:hypothetical protein